jgi:hypothetical protein
VLFVTSSLLGEGIAARVETSAYQKETAALLVRIADALDHAIATASSTVT